MSKYLVWTAIGGIGLGIMSTAVSVAMGVNQFNDFNRRGFSWFRDACPDTGAVRETAAERRLPWHGGTSIGIAVPADVYYRGGDGDDIVLRGSGDVIEHIVLEQESLRLTCKPKNGFGQISITLPGVPFDEVSVAGSSRIEMENVSQDDLTLNIAGSGSFTVNGTSDAMTVSIAGSGSADLSGVAVERLNVNIAGSGSVDAGPKEEAQINIMGSGDVTLLSNPSRIDSNIMGSGRVIRPESQAL